MNHNIYSQFGKLECVQVLRAIAAIAVVTVHIPVPLGKGGWGVDLFFVISGFIMCYVTERSGDGEVMRTVG